MSNDKNAAVEAFLVEKANKLAGIVRANFETTGRGMPSGEAVHVHKFTPKDIERAVDMNLVEKRKGKEGGLFPFGAVPEKSGDDTPSVTSRAFDMILALSRGETIGPDAARALWEEREALNVKRRKE